MLGFDGMTVWAINPLMGPRPREITGPQADDDAPGRRRLRQPAARLQGQGPTVELVGTEPVQGIKMHRLRVTKKSGAIQEIYLNAETSLESRIVCRSSSDGRKGIVTLGILQLQGR